jgi:hypothetical protein
LGIVAADPAEHDLKASRIKRLRSAKLLLPTENCLCALLGNKVNLWIAKLVERDSWVLKLTGLGTILLLLSIPVWPQGCSLCYTQAASSGAQSVRALRNGILVLIAPPMLISAGFTLLAYKKRNNFRDDIDSRENEGFDE